MSQPPGGRQSTGMGTLGRQAQAAPGAASTLLALISRAAGRWLACLVLLASLWPWAGLAQAPAPAPVTPPPAAPAVPPPAAPGWTLADGRTLLGEILSLGSDLVTLKQADGKTVQFNVGELPEPEQRRLLDLEDQPQPPRAPAWLPGYAARYPLRVIGPLQGRESQTVIAAIPTGGWLKPDLSDLVVTNGAGQPLPIGVLSHNPLGDTIIQFRRQGLDRWYWVYLHNPAAPDQDKALVARLAQLKAAADEVGRRKLALQQVSADKAAALRDLEQDIASHEQTVASATAELASWDKERPVRSTRQQQAKVAIPPLKVIADEATTTHAPLAEAATRLTDAAREPSRLLTAARAELQKAQAAVAAATKAEATARAALPAATGAIGKAEEAATLAQTAATTANTAADAAEAQVAAIKARLSQLQGEPKAAAERELADKTRVAAAVRQQAALKATAATSATTALAAARQKLAALDTEQKTQEAALPALKLAVPVAEEKVKQLLPAAETAELAAANARLALAPAERELAAANQALTSAVSALKAGDTAIEEMNQRIAAANQTKSTSVAALATLRPKLAPTQQAATAAAAATEAAVKDFTAKDKAYYDLAHALDPSLFREGLTVEFRAWQGDQLAGWPEVVAGLSRSETILGNAIVGEIMHDMNPFRRSSPRLFSASYRGSLQITEPGYYGFFANGDDTAFLFMRGYRIYSRTGSNTPIRGKIALYSVGSDIELEAGVHPFELHQVVGNSPAATGLQTLLWLPPNAKNWGFVPRARLRQSLLALPGPLEASDGQPLASFEFGMDDTLSADGLTLYLGRLAAQGAKLGEPAKLRWTLGDGRTRTGTGFEELFFAEGEQVVALQSHPKLPPFRRLISIWTPPTPTSPLALGRAVAILSQSDMSKLSLGQQADLFHFLRLCAQPTRWPVLQRVCEALLAQPNLDLGFRQELYGQLLLAQARQGRGEAAFTILDQAWPELAKARATRAALELTVANLWRDELRHFGEADKRYGALITDYARLRHPIVRRAAVAWGDMFMRGGDLARAADSYRLARSLGAVGAGVDSEGDPVKRGALLRVAEQQLKEGNIRQSQRLLQRLEEEFPEQKLEGLYRYLRGESRRHAGDYEGAVEDYEAVLAMPAWAGYRAHASFGIADCYKRLGDFARALEVYGGVADQFPAFVEDRKLAPYAEALKARLAPAGETAAANALFATVTRDFETPAPVGGAGEPLRALPLQGMDGVHTLLLDARLGATAQVPLIPLTNLPTQGSLWVEFWYRDHLGQAPPGEHRSFDLSVLDSASQVVDRVVFNQRRTFGQWHKAGFALRLPVTRDAFIKLILRDLGGTLEIDGLRVTHVSDAASHALRNFLEGADPQ